MPATAVYDLQGETIPAPRKRLLREHRQKRSWHKVAKARGVNVRYVHAFGVHGRLPQNVVIRKRLLARIPVNEPRPVPIEPVRRVLTGGWKLPGGRWGTVEDAIGRKP